MPRPPKSVRDALKAAGEWDFQPSPPPFDPIAAFCAGPDLVAPVPGAYEPVFDFSVPPDATFEGGNPFGEIPEEVSSILEHDLPNPGVFQGLAWDALSLTQNLFSTAYAVAAVQTACAHECVTEEETVLGKLVDQEVRLPAFLTSVIERLGEISGPDGRKWKLVDYPSTVKALTRAALAHDEGIEPSRIHDLFWLPCHVDDGRTASVLAVAMSHYLTDRGINIRETELIDKIFSGSFPPNLSAYARQLPSSELEALGEFFKTYSTEGEFLTRFSQPRGQRGLSLLGITWDHPSRLDLGFDIIPVLSVSHLLHRWRSIWRTVQTGIGVSFRKVRYVSSGFSGQLHSFRERPGGVTLTSHYHVDAHSASYLACFGQPVVYTSAPLRMSANARIHTSSIRASILRDHLGVDG